MLERIPAARAFEFRSNIPAHSRRMGGMAFPLGVTNVPWVVHHFASCHGIRGNTCGKLRSILDSGLVNNSKQLFHSFPAWWFQTCFIFHFIYGMSSFPLTSRRAAGSRDGSAAIWWEESAGAVVDGSSLVAILSRCSRHGEFQGWSENCVGKPREKYGKWKRSVQ